jgi:hypothetical protein
VQTTHKNAHLILLDNPPRARIEVVEYDPERYKMQYLADCEAFTQPPEPDAGEEVWGEYLEATQPRTVAEPLATWNIGEVTRVLPRCPGR